MKKFFSVAVCLAVLLLQTGAASSPHPLSVAMIWRIAAPRSSDASLQALEAALTAVGPLDAQLTALSARPRWHAAFALDPRFVAGLERVPATDSALSLLANGRLRAGDPRAAELLEILSRPKAFDEQLLRTPAGRRFAAYAAAAAPALSGNNAPRFSTFDLIDFAATAMLLDLRATGNARELVPLLSRAALGARDLQRIDDALAANARDIRAKLKSMAASGAIELAALPADEPIMPLVLDAAGRTRDVPYTVDLQGRDDVGAAIDKGMNAVRTLDAGAPGVVSPHGAYDDATAALLQEHSPAYATFSDRVVKAVSGASSEAVAATSAAALRPYLLSTSRTSKLPVLFCSDALSAELTVVPPTAAATVFGDRLRAMAATARAAHPSDGILLLCMDIDALSLQRSDRSAILDHLGSVLSASSDLEATTPKEYLRRHSVGAQAYGFQPASDVGGFDLWMGSANQASLWTTLADARKALGREARGKRSDVQAALLRAESNRWFSALSLPQPRATTELALRQYRSAIAQIYRAAVLAIPANLAPVKWERPTPMSSPKATGR